MKNILIAFLFFFSLGLLAQAPASVGSVGYSSGVPSFTPSATGYFFWVNTATNTAYMYDGGWKKISDYFRNGANTITANTTFNGPFDWRMGNATALDTVQIKAARIVLEAPISVNGDVDMNSYDLIEVDSLTSANSVTINSTSSQTPLVLSGSFHSNPTIRAINGAGNAGIILENTPDDTHSYALMRMGDGQLRLSRSADQPYSAETDTIFNYDPATGEIDFIVDDILLNGAPLGGTGDDLGNHTATQALDMNQFNILDANKVTSDSADIDVLAGSIAAPGTLNVGTLQIGGNAITDGTWTPTLTNTLNLDASTSYTCNYMRVGNTVTVSGRVDCNPTATGTVILEMSLPIASNFASFENAGGTGAISTNIGVPIYASSANDRLIFTYTATQTSSEPIHFSATYRIQ